MKDTSGGYIGVFKITVLAELVPGAWYDTWTCVQCGALLTLEAMLRPGPGPILTVNGPGVQIRTTCPKCHVDRLYGINDRQVLQVPA